MKIHISIITLIIGLSSVSLTNAFDYKSNLNIYGNWEYEKVIIDGKEIDPTNLNRCRYRDVLEVRKNELFDNEFEGIKLERSRIWISNKKSCTFDILNFKEIIAINSCPTYWLKIENSINRIISIADGEVIEYEISKPSRKKMILSKIREIVSFGNSIPDEIHLRKIKKEN